MDMYLILPFLACAGIFQLAPVTSSNIQRISRDVSFQMECCLCDDFDNDPNNDCTEMKCYNDLKSSQRKLIVQCEYCQYTEIYSGGTWKKKGQCSVGPLCEHDYSRTVATPGCFGAGAPIEDTTCYYCCRSPDVMSPAEYCINETMTGYSKFMKYNSVSQAPPLIASTTASIVTSKPPNSVVTSTNVMTTPLQNACSVCDSRNSPNCNDQIAACNTGQCQNRLTFDTTGSLTHIVKSCVPDILCNINTQTNDIVRCNPFFANRASPNGIVCTYCCDPKSSTTPCNTEAVIGSRPVPPNTTISSPATPVVSTTSSVVTSLTSKAPSTVVTSKAPSSVVLSKASSSVVTSKAPSSVVTSKLPSSTATSTEPSTIVTTPLQNACSVCDSRNSSNCNDQTLSCDTGRCQNRLTFDTSGALTHIVKSCVPDVLCNINTQSNDIVRCNPFFANRASPNGIVCTYCCDPKSSTTPCNTEAILKTRPVPPPTSSIVTSKIPSSAITSTKVTTIVTTPLPNACSVCDSRNSSNCNDQMAVCDTGKCQNRLTFDASGALTHIVKSCVPDVLCNINTQTNDIVRCNPFFANRASPSGIVCTYCCDPKLSTTPCNTDAVLRTHTVPQPRMVNPLQRNYLSYRAANVKFQEECCICDDFDNDPSNDCSEERCRVDLYSSTRQSISQCEYCQFEQMYSGSRWKTKVQCSVQSLCEHDHTRTAATQGCFGQGTPEPDATCYYCCRKPDALAPSDYCINDTLTGYTKFSRFPNIATVPSTEPSTTTTMGPTTGCSVCTDSQGQNCNSNTMTTCDGQCQNRMVYDKSGSLVFISKSCALENECTVNIANNDLIRCSPFMANKASPNGIICTYCCDPKSPNAPCNKELIPPKHPALPITSPAVSATTRQLTTPTTTVMSTTSTIPSTASTTTPSTTMKVTTTMTTSTASTTPTKAANFTNMCTICVNENGGNCMDQTQVCESKCQNRLVYDKSGSLLFVSKSCALEKECDLNIAINDPIRCSAFMINKASPNGIVCTYCCDPKLPMATCNGGLTPIPGTGYVPSPPKTTTQSPTSTKMMTTASTTSPIISSFTVKSSTQDSTLSSPVTTNTLSSMTTPPVTSFPSSQSTSMSSTSTPGSTTIPPSSTQTSSTITSSRSTTISTPTTPGPTKGSSMMTSGSTQSSSTTSGSTQSTSMMTSDSTKSSSMMTSGSTKSSSMMTSGSTQSSSMKTSGSTQSSLMTSGSTQSSSTMTSGSTQRSSMMTSGSTQSSSMMTSGSTQSSSTMTSGSTQSSSMMTSGSTQSSSMMTSGSTQSPTMKTSGSTQSSLMTSGSTQSSSTMTSGSSQNSSMMTSGLTRSSSMKTSGSTRSSSTASSATQRSSMMTSGPTQSSSMMTSGSTQSSSLKTPGSTQISSLTSGPTKSSSMMTSGPTQQGSTMTSSPITNPSMMTSMMSSTQGSMSPSTAPTQGSTLLSPSTFKPVTSTESTTFAIPTLPKSTLISKLTDTTTMTTKSVSEASTTMTMTTTNFKTDDTTVTTISDGSSTSNEITPDPLDMTTADSMTYCTVCFDSQGQNCNGTTAQCDGKCQNRLIYNKDGSLALVTKSCAVETECNVNIKNNDLVICNSTTADKSSPNGIVCTYCCDPMSSGLTCNNEMVPGA